MTGEIIVLRLPVRLSDLVDEAVGRFLASHGNEQLEAYRRYHGADLWMVYKHEPAGESEPAFLTRRVTIGLYSDDPDHLRFIPDIVVTRPEGRYILEYDPGWEKIQDHIAPISLLQVQLGTDPERASHELLDEPYLGSITRALVRTWNAAEKLKPDQARQLIT